jgi:hypothetical protein
MSAYLVIRSIIWSPAPGPCGALDLDWRVRILQLPVHCRICIVHPASYSNSPTSSSSSILSPFVRVNRNQIKKGLGFGSPAGHLCCPPATMAYVPPSTSMAHVQSPPAELNLPVTDLQVKYVPVLAFAARSAASNCEASSSVTCVDQIRIPLLLNH